jgi:biotin operon repressor
MLTRSAGASRRSAAVMWSVSRIAARDGISKQAVSKKVRELVGLGLTVETDGQGRVTAVNSAEYDRLRARTDDPSKAQAPADKPTRDAGPKSYDEALRQKTWYEAEKRRLELEELKGQLVRADAVADAVASCGGAIATICDRLANAADEFAAALAKGGVHALRLALKEAARQQRVDIAGALAAIADAAPLEDLDDDEADDDESAEP